MGTLHRCRRAAKELNFIAIAFNRNRSRDFGSHVTLEVGKARDILAILLVCFLLAAPAYAQGLEEAASLDRQVIQLSQQGRYSEAVPLAERVLAIREEALGSNHPQVALALYSLAILFTSQGRYADAEQLFIRSVAIDDKVFGPDNTVSATTLSDLAELYRIQHRYADAEPLAKRSLASLEKAHGPNDPRIAYPLNNLASLYQDEGRYADAEPLYKRALAIREKALGSDNLDYASSLNNLASLYRDEGRYADAEPLYKRSLAVAEKAFGPNHPSVARSLNNLASLYQDQGRLSDAEQLYKRSLDIRAKALDPDDPDIAVSLNNLGTLYLLQGRFADAEPLLKRSLSVFEKVFGQNDPNFAETLNNLAQLYQKQGRYADAEPLFKRALAIYETSSSDNPDITASLNNLATLYDDQGRYADAEPLYKRSLATNEKIFGPNHPYVAQSLNNLALLYEKQGRYADADPLYERSLGINEKAFGTDSVEVATSLHNLAAAYADVGRYADAEPLFKRSLVIYEHALGTDHPDVAGTLNSLAELYNSLGRFADAEPLFKRSLAIYEKVFGPDHPDVALLLNNLAELYNTLGRYDNAELLLTRSLTTSEKIFGPNHPDVAASLNNLASLYKNQKRYTEAEPLLKRALEIDERAFGSDHPTVALDLNNLADLYLMQRRYAEAEQLNKRSLAIDSMIFDHNHPSVVRSLNNLAALYQVEGRYVDALPIVRDTVVQTAVALKVLYGAQTKKLIVPSEAMESSFAAFQRSASSAAGIAVSKLMARFAAGTSELARLVRKDQDLTAESDLLDKNIIAAMSKSSLERNSAVEDQIHKRIGEVKLEHDRLQEELNRRFPDYVVLSKPPPLSVKDTQSLLAGDEALIAIEFDATDFVWEWVITRDQAEWQQLSISATDISNDVANLRLALTPDSLKSFDRDIAFRLYQQLLGPISKVISEKKRLSFVLSGALTSLPPQVLIANDPEGKDIESVDWLIRKYAITVLPSVVSLRILRAGGSIAEASKPMIGFGNPVFERSEQAPSKQKLASLKRSPSEFYRGEVADTKSLGEALSPLPETADELRAVGKALNASPADINLGEAATVTSVKHAPLDRYGVVYFATHALVAGQVEKYVKVKAEPAIVLSIPDKPTDYDDGLLRASDVAMLKMNADFVVLSACNTAAGDRPGAEALSGLARAFFYAGARSLIVSHWEVDSESTVALMTGLFDALKADPHLSHAEALQLSMLKMINSSSRPEWAQPQFWAPFVVVGEPQKR